MVTSPHHQMHSPSDALSLWLLAAAHSHDQGGWAGVLEVSGVLCTQQHRQQGTSKIQSLESLFPRAFLETAGSYFKKLHP